MLRQGPSLGFGLAKVDDHGGALLGQAACDGRTDPLGRSGNQSASTGQELFSAFAADRDLELDDVLGAVSATTPLSRTAPEDIKRIRKWAESRARPASAPEAAALRKATQSRGPRVALSIDSKGDN